MKRTWNGGSAGLGATGIVQESEHVLYRRITALLGTLAIAILVLIELYPVFWLLTSSIKAPIEFSTRPIYALPDGFYWKNYVDAWTVGRMNTYFRNSLIATIPSLFFILLFGSAAAFAIEKMQWRFSNLVLLVFLSGIMIPVQIVLLPLFTAFLRLNMLNNLGTLILVYTTFGLSLTIFLFTSYFKAVPNEVIESAIIDGANIYQVYWHVAIPMVLNAFVTIALVQFFFVWNDLVFSMTFIRDTNMRTIQTGLLSFAGEFGQRNWGATFASISLAVIPTLLLYLALNKLVMKGVTAGAVKG